MKGIAGKGVFLPEKEGINKSILGFLKTLLEKYVFDGIMVPMRVPAKNSYAWVLVREPSLIMKASPLAPVMPVQGAKALKSLTRKGKGTLNFAVLMRPCEIRASIELTKLNQIHPEKITLMSIDCPGALPLSDYIQNPEEGEKRFEALFTGESWSDETSKPVCQICDQFSWQPASDLHFGLMRGQKKGIFLISNSEKGQRVLNEMKLQASESVSEWKKSIEDLTKKRQKKREKRFEEVQTMAKGFEPLLETFAACIGCHNCQSACPICYCRQCYFNSTISRPDSDFIFQKAEVRGGISFPMDRIFFHVGRMTHMSLSCVSCGLCSDACPVSIPVAEVFSYVADQTQRTFEYRAGESGEDAIPITRYRMEEIQGVQNIVHQAEGAMSKDG